MGGVHLQTVHKLLQGVNVRAGDAQDDPLHLLLATVARVVDEVNVVVSQERLGLQVRQQVHRRDVLRGGGAGGGGAGERERGRKSRRRGRGGVNRRKARMSKGRNVGKGGEGAEREGLNWGGGGVEWQKGRIP